MLAIISIIIAYLIGSLSTAIILSKLMHFPDPRTQGSGNAGATNVLRTVGKNKALMTLIGDVVKGLIAVIIARILGVEGFALGLVALAVVVGHVFPVFFNFQGGKGVAPAVGAIIATSFWVGIIVAIIWIGITLITRYISLASIIAIAVAPILVLIISNSAYAFPFLLIAILIIWKHKENIDRLRKGIEPKAVF